MSDRFIPRRSSTTDVSYLNLTSETTTDECNNIYKNYLAATLLDGLEKRVLCFGCKSVASAEASVLCALANVNSKYLRISL